MSPLLSWLLLLALFVVVARTLWELDRIAPAIERAVHRTIIHPWLRKRTNAQFCSGCHERINFVRPMSHRRGSK